MRLKLAKQHLEGAQGLARKQLDKSLLVHERLRVKLREVGEHLAQVQHDNDTIYHDMMPHSLDDPKPVIAVKPAPITAAGLAQDAAQTDPWAAVVPRDMFAVFSKFAEDERALLRGVREGLAADAGQEQAELAVQSWRCRCHSSCL